MGIDVGQEQSMKEPRSHIEGATPATAIWSFGIVPDPFAAGQPPGAPRPPDPGRRLPPAETDRGPAQPALSSCSSRSAADERAEVQPNLSAAMPAKLERRHRPQPAEPSGSGPSTRHSEAGRRPGSAGEPGRGGRQCRPRPKRSATSRRAALAADHRRDDVQRLPDHQGARSASRSTPRWR